LGRDLPISERWSYWAERRFGWRAPESAIRYLFRSSVQLDLMLLPLIALVLVGTAWDSVIFWIALRMIIMATLYTPLYLFVVGLLYFKIRDAMWGAFGRRRSALRACLWAVLMAVLTFSGFLSLDYWNIAGVALAPSRCLLAARGCTIFYVYLAYTVGPTEIQDAMWRCLTLDD
jgi:hypothetical protein